MIFKIMVGFLVFMVILSLFGKFKFPGQEKLAAAKCPNCKRYKIGKGPCQCRKGRT